MLFKLFLKSAIESETYKKQKIRTKVLIFLISLNFSGKLPAGVRQAFRNSRKSLARVQELLYLPENVLQGCDKLL